MCFFAWGPWESRIAYGQKQLMSYRILSSSLVSVNFFYLFFFFTKTWIPGSSRRLTQPRSSHRQTFGPVWNPPSSPNMIRGSTAVTACKGCDYWLSTPSLCVQSITSKLKVTNHCFCGESMEMMNCSSHITLKHKEGLFHNSCDYWVSHCY